MLNFGLGSGSGVTRMWDIKVTQFACGEERGGNIPTAEKLLKNDYSQTFFFPPVEKYISHFYWRVFIFVIHVLGPDNCLQYFTGDAGTISK